MEFSNGPAPCSAYVRVSFRVLHEMLRLPKDVTITAVRSDPNDCHKCIIDMEGALPIEGELVAKYKYKETTVVEFAGFAQP